MSSLTTEYLSRRKPISTALLLVGYCSVGHTGATVDVEEPTILLHYNIAVPVPASTAVLSTNNRSSRLSNSILK